MNRKYEEKVNDENLSRVIDKIIKSTKIIDMHTHLFPIQFEELCLAGIDDLLNYHYLIAEAMRWIDIPYDEFWSLIQENRSELIWNYLFAENSPLSEAATGVITILNEMGISIKNKDLNNIRKQFRGIDKHEYISRILDVTGVEKIVMTNDPLDERERELLLKECDPDPRFLYSLRLDKLINNWADSVNSLNKMGYKVNVEIDPATIKEVCRFLIDWISKLNPVYIAISLPYAFDFPDETFRTTLFKECLLPICQEVNKPVALMVGTKRSVNPKLRLAGDALGNAKLDSIEYLCTNYSDNKFLVTMLSRENQHELTVLARKFRNLMIFGCWWFLNIPKIVDEITRIRFELLGTSFIPQHSDCRVFDQLIYKWKHSLEIIKNILIEKYEVLIAKGWPLSESDIKNDINQLLRQNFIDFVNL